MNTSRLSVRSLVEFTLHGDDIRPGGSVFKAMQEGMLGHKARQALLPMPWQSEVPLTLTLSLEQGEQEVLLSGRMDAYLPGEVPQVEEIKLWPARLPPPEEPLPAHLAQAVCYGHMLCETEGISRVMVSVVYVTTAGRLLVSHEREMTAEECRAAFMALWEPWAQRKRMELAHERARDASLRALSFPYDAYRPGQREMAVQVYTAIRRGLRLFAQMPTGTGKSAAALFPALKAMGEGLTGRVYYLTARTTQRQGPVDALALIRRQPLHLWTLVLDAKDKQCPDKTLCHPDFCPRAKGHFLRDGEAITELLKEQDWTPQVIREVADRHMLCPFELSLSLAQLADLTICDYNYALDPAVHIQRIFDRTSDVTLLIDEAHHLPDRLRDMLSGHIDGPAIRRLRQTLGKLKGRRHPLYKAMTDTLNALTDLPVPEEEQEGRLGELPQSLRKAAVELAEAFAEAYGESIPWQDDAFMDTLNGLTGFVRAMRREQETAWLWQGSDRSRHAYALALDVGGHFAAATRGMNGVICFSATLSPLPAMKRLLGGEEEDALFSVPSPFPREHLRLLTRPIDTRFPNREASVPEIVEAICRLWQERPCRCMVFFPSFAYMKQVSEQLQLPHQRQTASMTEEERQAFLKPYHEAEAPLLSLCVLGGVFSQGIDLPGDKLEAVVIVGTGLPQVNLFSRTLRDWYQANLGDGFLYAYRIPGLQKVAQAVGRLIRSETDTGTALLLDRSYGDPIIRSMLPWEQPWEQDRGGRPGS